MIVRTAVAPDKKGCSSRLFLEQQPPHSANPYLNLSPKRERLEQPQQPQQPHLHLYYPSPLGRLGGVSSPQQPPHSANPYLNLSPTSSGLRPPSPTGEGKWYLSFWERLEQPQQPRLNLYYPSPLGRLGGDNHHEATPEFVLSLPLGEVRRGQSPEQPPHPRPLSGWRGE